MRKKDILQLALCVSLAVTINARIAHKRAETLIALRNPMENLAQELKCGVSQHSIDPETENAKMTTEGYPKSWKKVGAGAFGVVFVNKLTQTARKVYKSNDLEKLLREARREVVNLKSVIGNSNAFGHCKVDMSNHRQYRGTNCVVPYYNCTYSAEKIFVNMRSLNGAELQSFVASNRQWFMNNNIKYFDVAAHLTFQLMAGLSQLQASGLVHQDLKPANVFVEYRDANGNWLHSFWDYSLRIIDLGAARKCDLKANLCPCVGSFAFTRNTAAPETLANEIRIRKDTTAILTVKPLLYGDGPPEQKSGTNSPCQPLSIAMVGSRDVYSMGITSFFTFFGRMPAFFKQKLNNPTVDIFNKLSAGNSYLWEGIDGHFVSFGYTEEEYQKIKAFINALTQVKPECRLTPTEAMSGKASPRTENCDLPDGWNALLSNYDSWYSTTK